MTLPFFRLRIVNIDYYLSPPIPNLDVEYSLFSRCKLSRVPVLRIYGSTPAGQKACLHIHNYFPYLYIPIPDSVSEDSMAAFVNQLGSAIDTGLDHVQSRSNGMFASLAYQRRYVYSIYVIKAMPFYGYTTTRKRFAKVELMEPSLIGRTATLLLAGVIMNQVFQPHESHIPYLLHFMADYNLTGMGFVDLSSVTFRQPVPSARHPLRSQTRFSLPWPPTQTSRVHQHISYDLNEDPSYGVLPLQPFNSYWTDATIPPHALMSLQVSRLTCCTIEADALGIHILNRLEFAPGTHEHSLRVSAVNMHNSGATQEITEEEFQFLQQQMLTADNKLVVSLASIWESEKRRQRQQYLNTKDTSELRADAITFPTGVDPCSVRLTPPASGSRDVRQHSLIEQRYLDHLQKIIGLEEGILQSYTSTPPAQTTAALPVSVGLSKSSDLYNLLSELQSQPFLTDTTLNHNAADTCSVLFSPAPLCQSPHKRTDLSLSIPLESEVDADRLAVAGVWLPDDETLLDRDSDLLSQQQEAQDIIACTQDVGEKAESTTTKKTKTKMNDDSYDIDIDDEDEEESCQERKVSIIPQSDGGDDDIDIDIERDHDVKQDIFVPSSLPSPVHCEEARFSPSQPASVLISVSEDLQTSKAEKNKLTVNNHESYFDDSQSSRYMLDRENISDAEMNDDEQIDEIPQTPAAPSRSSFSFASLDWKLDSNSIELGEHPSTLRFEKYDDSNADNDVVDSVSSASLVSPPSYITPLKYAHCDEEVQGSNAESDDLSPSLHNVVGVIIPSSPHAAALPEHLKVNITETVNASDSADNALRDAHQTAIVDYRHIAGSRCWHLYATKPPCVSRLMKLMPATSWLQYTTPFYSHPLHIPTVTMSFGGRIFRNPGHPDNSSNVPEFVSCLRLSHRQRHQQCSPQHISHSKHQAFKYILAPIKAPPHPDSFFLSTSININRPSDIVNNKPPNVQSNIKTLDSCGQEVYNCYRETGEEGLSDRHNKHNPMLAVPNSHCVLNDGGIGTILTSNDPESISLSSSASASASASSIENRSVPVQKIEDDLQGYSFQETQLFQVSITDTAKRVKLLCQEDEAEDALLSIESPSVNGRFSHDANPVGPTHIEKRQEDQHTPRPASPKYDENFLSSVSYFLPPETAMSSPTKQRPLRKFTKFFDNNQRTAVVNSRPAVDTATKSENHKSSSTIPMPASSNNAYNIDTAYASSVSNHAAVAESCTHLSTLSVEIQTASRADLNPDPAIDAIQAIVFYFHQETDSVHLSPQSVVGILMWVPPCKLMSPLIWPRHFGLALGSLLIDEQACSTTYRALEPMIFDHESQMLDAFIGLVRHYDPDILLGYEVQRHSLGYIIDRASIVWSDSSRDIVAELSRTPPYAQSATTSRNTNVSPASAAASATTTTTTASSSSSSFVTSNTFLRTWGHITSEIAVNTTSSRNNLGSSLGEKVGTMAPESHNIAYSVNEHAADFSVDQQDVSRKRFSRRLRSNNNNIKYDNNINVSQSQPSTHEAQRYSQSHSSGLSISGRIVINVWRLMRSELKLNIYSFENIVFHVLSRRLPHYSTRTLSTWWNRGLSYLSSLADPANVSSNGVALTSSSVEWFARSLSYHMSRCILTLSVLERLDLFGRTSELARVFGIQFYCVLSRGSQYRVESMMLRITKRLGYVMVSPSRKQVSEQPAMECLPLVMEPESQMYTSPLIVLDFQSLYPSIVIAYNLCYSTCLGKLQLPQSIHPTDGNTSCQLSWEKILGATSLQLPLGLLKHLHDSIWISPNGVMYVKSKARKGILPRLLNEILDTRVMIKNAMKHETVKKNPSLYRLLNARQFGLKMIANVTYGYTAAGFSGRMPMAELADTIVQTARETLENAIKLVESNQSWQAKVVYGDTDSLFVLVPGRSRQDAFRIGQEIASQVTVTNPKPIKLQMEKVYHPSVLISKKRYVGYKYESAQQSTPEFDAKGIETVRRDSCPAVAKIMEKSIRLLFDSKDLSLVRLYLEKQWSRILSGRINIQDFIFAKEVKLGNYSKRGPPPAAAVVAIEQMRRDPRADPLYGERIPYVVVDGPSNARIVDLVIPPMIFLLGVPSRRYTLNAKYYITRQINSSLARIFNLVGADVANWFTCMARPRGIARLLEHQQAARTSSMAHLDHPLEPFGSDERSSSQKRKAHCFAHGHSHSSSSRAQTMEQFYQSDLCVLCDGVIPLSATRANVCPACAADNQTLALVGFQRMRQREKEYHQILQICMLCASASCQVSLPHSSSVLVDHHSSRSLISWTILSQTLAVPNHCSSLDCSFFFHRLASRERLSLLRSQLQQFDLSF